MTYLTMPHLLGEDLFRGPRYFTPRCPFDWAPAAVAEVTSPRPPQFPAYVFTLLVFTGIILATCT